MPVGSTIELYTTVLGWLLYGAIWDILSSTGIILIPFIVTIVKTLLDTRDSTQEVDADGLVRVMETRVYVMLFVVFFAAQPQINVNPAKTTYTQYRCGVTASKSLTKSLATLAYGNSKSTLDKAAPTFGVMLGARIPQAPLWWYLVTKLNHAITQAARQELPCQADLRVMGAGLSKLNIPDKALKDELKDFYKDCWQPSVNVFRSQQLTDTDLPAQYKGGAVYDDITWPGSRYFMTQAGFYDTIRANTRVAAFPYSVLRDDSKAPAPPAGAVGVDAGGFPTCHEWWLGYPSTGGGINSDRGLRTRLLENIKTYALPTDKADSAGSWWRFWADDKFATAADADNALIKTALAAESSDIQLELTNGSTDYGGAMGSTADQMVRGVRSSLGSLGLLWSGATKSVEVEMARQVAPMVQSMVLLIFTVGLPIFLVLGSYSLQSLFALTLLQFSLIFWGFLFSLAAWLDNFLLSGLWASADKNANTLMDTLIPGGNIVGGGGVATQILAITWVTWLLYTLTPLAFTYFLGVVGVRAGDKVTQVLGSESGNVAKAGGDGVGVAKQIITKGKGR